MGWNDHHMNLWDHPDPPEALRAMADEVRDRQKYEPSQCETCGGTDREGGSVIVAGPDENGQFDTEDCPNPFHSPRGDRSGDT